MSATREPKPCHGAYGRLPMAAPGTRSHWSNKALDLVARVSAAATWIGGACSGRELLQRSALAACDLLDVPLAWCALPLNSELHVAAHHGLRSRDTAKLWCLPVGVGIVGRVAATGETILVHDWENDPRRIPGNPSIVEAEGICWGIAAPMHSARGIIGVLSLGDRRWRQVPLMHVEALTELSRRVGQALCVLLERERYPELHPLGPAGRGLRRPSLRPGSWGAPARAGYRRGYGAVRVPHAYRVA